MRGRAQFLKRGIPAPDYRTPTPEPVNAVIGEEIIISPYEGYIYLRNGATEIPTQRVVETTARTTNNLTYLSDNARVGSKVLQLTIVGTPPQSYPADYFNGGGLLVSTYASGGPGGDVNAVNSAIEMFGSFLPLQGNTPISNTEANQTVEITLVDPLPFFIETATSPTLYTWAQLLGPIFGDVQLGQFNANRPVGVSRTVIPPYHYFWAQNYGITVVPHFSVFSLTSISFARPSFDARNEAFVKEADGSIDYIRNFANVGQNQIVGYTIPYEARTGQPNSEYITNGVPIFLDM